MRKMLGLEWFQPTKTWTVVLSLLPIIALTFAGYAAADTPTVTMSCTPDPVALNDTTSCTVTVSTTPNGIPTGSVTVTPNNTGTVSNNTCGTLSGGQCTFDYTPTSGTGTHTFTLNYVSNNATNWNNSAGAGSVMVTARQSQTIVECSATPLVVNASTLCTATVTDATLYGGPVPTGTVSFSHSGTGNFSAGSCSLDTNGQCSVSYTPTDAATNPHSITASYGGNSTFSASSDSFSQALQLRAADVLLNCQPSNVFINQTIPCQVTVIDDSTDGTPVTPQGSVGFDDGVKAGTFSAASCTLSSGTCSVNYTPGAGDAGITTVTATYTPAASPAVHAAGSNTQQLAVSLRPTTTTIVCQDSASVVGGLIFVNETATCTVTVNDTGPAPITTPTGTVTITKTGPSVATFPGSCTLAAGQCTFTFTPTSLPVVMAGYDVISAAYNGTTVHAASGGAYAQTIQRRTTQNVVSCPTPAPTTACTSTVTDTAPRGTSSTPAGEIRNPGDNSLLCTLAGGSCGFNVTVPSIMVNVSARYDPTDNVHMQSVGGANITLTSADIPSTPTGAKDIAQLVFDLTASCLAADVAALAIDVAQIPISLIPDPVTAAGFLVVFGISIPIKDIAAAILSGAQVILNTFTLAACTDLDGDGLYGVIEMNATNTNDNNWDTDGDRMGDGDEIFSFFADGLYGGTGNDFDGDGVNDDPVCPSPSIADTDEDGLLDGEEDEDFGTEFCNSDSDYDNAGGHNSDFYEVKTSHTDPTDPDTDDDGLCDEDGTGLSTQPGLKGCPVHPLSGIARSEFSAGTSSFDPDTDGDEILDGDEDYDGDGIYGLADTTTLFGYFAEPDPTLFDTDLDDLSDGYELGSGSGCDPSLPDTDSDDLSDSEEVNETQTTCSVVDSDGDGLPDADEHFVMSGVFPTRDLEQVTDPLIKDTDGDGRNDNLEYSGSQIGTTTGPGQPDTCVPGVSDTGPGLANSFDSDDDGLNDGPDFLLGADLSDAAGNDDELSTDTLASICDPDSDDDGILDGGEVGHGVDPLDWDSDDDGLSDWEELEVYFTNPNNVDTDGDQAGNAPVTGTTNFILDGDRTSIGRFDHTTNSITSFTVAGVVCLSDCEESLSDTTLGAFTGEIRDETDALQKDTDGDGIQDDDEFIPGCNATNGSAAANLVDGFANSFDSDGDGAHDGVEVGADGMGGFTNLAGAGDVIASNGNNYELHDDPITNICDPDADGDGLLDGEELGKNGAVSPPGSQVNYAGPLNYLDWDSDDDGLSDYEELNIYFTDPALADTDGDLADGVIPSRTPAFTDSAHPALTGHSGAGTIACLSDCEEAYSGTLLFNPAFVAVPGLPPAPGAAAGFGNPLDETDPLQQDTDGDGINDNVEFQPGCNTTNTNSGSALFDGFANSFDSDADGLRDFEDAVADVFNAASISIDKTPVTRVWASYPETPRPLPGFAKAPSPDGLNDGELSDDAITGICDPDSDGDGVLDGEEHQIQSDIYDWDTDDDGREDSEFLGEGPIPTDPFDFDTDDDGLGDGVEVFGANTTNPVNADTDVDGLCDGGATTPASTQFGPAPGPGGIATGGVDGAGSNPLCYTGVAANPNDGASPNAITPTPSGWGEDVSGDGTLDASETDPNDFDTDDDAVGDGVELLAFYTSRQSQIPAADLFGRTINVDYPQQDTFVCMDPLNPDSDGDGLNDGVEDLSHDGIFDFEPGDFDHAGQGPIPGPAQDNPEETNPCDPDSDDDTLNDFLERNQPNLPAGSTTAPQSFYPFNPTNPLDHDTDNDYMLDGEEVFYVCPAAPPVFNLDNDNDGLIDEDPLDGIDNDFDGKTDEDGVDFRIFHVDFLDPTNRDTDGDGWIDGLDPGGFGGPCNTAQLPIVGPGTIVNPITDTDGDGFADDDEIAAGTDPFDPNSHPTAFFTDLDLDLHTEVLQGSLVDTQGQNLDADDDRLWLEDPDRDGIADSVVLDIDANVLVDVRVLIVNPGDVHIGDFDGDGAADDRRYVVVYALANYRFLQPRVTLVVDDFNGDGIIDRTELSIP